MRGPWLRTVVLWLMVGPASVLAEPADPEPVKSEKPSPGKPTGHMVRGLNFHAGDSGTSPLGCMLCLLPGLDRTCLISAWATSPNEKTRRALARAPSAPFEAVGVRAVVDHLQADPSPEVRRLARFAAAIRRASFG